MSYICLFIKHAWIQIWRNQRNVLRDDETFRDYENQTKQTNQIYRIRDDKHIYQQHQIKCRKKIGRREKRDYKSVGVIALLELFVPCLHGVTSDHLSFFCSHLSLSFHRSSLSLCVVFCLCFSSSFFKYSIAKVT